MIVITENSDLQLIAVCHQKCFPKSLSTQLGKKYLTKMFEWFLLSDNKFLFHLIIDGVVVGYCGGFSQKNDPYGSSSGMTQHAFRVGLYSFFLRPWLIFHPKIIKNLKFLFRNMRYRVKVLNTKTPVNLPISKDKHETTGLVVIGIIPLFQGKGYGSLMIREFEKLAKLQGSNKVNLVVEINNLKAIHSYQLNGWVKGKVHNSSLEMFKYLLD